MRITPVILCGGSGTRLWPVSTPSHPKQYHALAGPRSLLQETAERAIALELESPIVVCAHADREVVESQLAEVGVTPATVITEPGGRNTAPAMAAATLSVQDGGLMLVMPADHVVTDVEALRSAVASGAAAARAGRLVVFGVVATRPETGYGYIEAGEPQTGWTKVARFTEKPEPATAQRLVDSGYLWNSGMFLFEVSTAIEELDRWVPLVMDRVRAAMPGNFASRIELSEAFLEAPAIAFDRAVMEKTDRAAVVRLDAGWSDVGSWDALWDLLPKDSAGNVAQGDVTLLDVSGSYVRTTGRVVVLGLSDVVVVDAGGTVLVASRSASQRVTEVANPPRSHADTASPGVEEVDPGAGA